MLYTYAIEPDVLVTWDKCRNTLNLMGFRHGRAIVAYPSRKRWKKLILQACDRSRHCGEREKSRIHEKIREVDDKLVQAGTPVGYDGSIMPREECWIRNATDHQTGTGAFHAILSTRNPTSHRDVVLEEDVDESHEKLDVRREQPVPREPEALVTHVRTLVVNSREMLLIDPHLDLTRKRWRSVVAACLELAAKSVRGELRAEIHTLDTESKPSVQEFRKQCRRHVPGMMTGKLTSVRVCRWRRRENGPEDFHARYVLTDRGGYRLDKGLDEETGVEQSVVLLDDREWRRLREGYGGDGDKLFFEKADAFTLDPSGALRPEMPPGFPNDGSPETGAGRFP